MKKVLLFILFVLCAATGMRAQEVIIGTGTSSSEEYAFYPYYEDSWWESIYLPTEIGMQGLITSVALQSGSGPALMADNVYIYIGTRSTNSYSSTTDWTPLSNLTLVFSGTNLPLGGSNGWENYTLQTPYMYDGSSNLVVVFAKHASDYSDDATYYYHSTDNYSSLCRYMDEDPSYAQYSSTITGSRKYYRPNLKLSITPDSTFCGAVSNIQVTGITTDEATVSWDTPFNPHTYIVEVKEAAENWDSPYVLTYTTSDTFYTITGLDHSTTYNVRVANDCVDDTSNYTSASFSTQCAPVTVLPIIEDFDGYTHTTNPTNGAGSSNLPNCWDALNTGSSYSACPYVHYGTSLANSGDYSMRFYLGSGSSYADQYALLPIVDVNAISIQDLSLGFYMRRQGTNVTFTLVVGVMEDMNPATFTPIDTFTTTSATYVYHEVSFSNYSGTGNRIALKAPKPASGNNRGLVDDVVLNYLTNCQMVSDVTVSNITTTSAIVSWQSQGTETAWVVEYRENGSNVWQTEYANTNPYTLTSLNAATLYQVRVAADCGSEISNYTSNVSFATVTCDTADQCLYTFNLADDFGDGWNSASLRVQQGGQTVSTLTISNSSSSSATYQVPLCDSIPVTLVWVSGSYDDECSFVVVNPFGEAIFTASDPSAGTLTTFMPSCTPPSCPRPSSVTVSDIEDASATISWVSTGTETAWNIEYKPANSATWLTEPVTTNPYTLTGLTSLTNYDVRVQADCGGDVSDWRETSFMTAGCPLTDQCAYTFNLTDDFGDGWNGASLVVQQGGTTIATLTVASDYSAVFQIPLCDNLPITLIWMSGSFDDECSFTVVNPFNETIFTASDPNSGTLTSFTAHCVPPTCPAPSSISVSNIGTTSASVSWVSTGSETTWNIDYKPVNSTTWTSVSVTTNPYMLTGLTSLTAYDVRVQADCGGGDLSDWRTTNFNTSACEAYEQCVYTLSVTGEYDDSWDYCSLNVVQGGVTVATIEGVGYYATVQLSLCDGVSTSLVFNSGYFDDECGFTLSGPDGTVLQQQTDMSYFTNYTFTPDCGLSSLCMPPTGLFVNNVTQTTAVASWIAAGTEISWNVQYKAASASTWQNITANTTSCTLTGLTPGTAYQVKVQAVCDATTSSDWTEPVSFTTEQGQQTCPAPTNLTVSVDHTTVTLTWQQEPNTATEWQVNYRQTTESTWSTSTATSTTYVLTDLVPEVDYVAHVVAHCTNGLTSDESNTVNFHTTSVGIQGYLERSVNLYPNPATEMVSVEVSDANILITGVEVYNVFGQIVETFHGTSLQNRATINVSSLADGMYYVRVTTDNGVVTKSFVKR
ncbi:MAG: fibronectin type III domain-containing protein [Bacteroidales bacterium]|nr:fibronectin type III domain-containing protein [Bacteroidales bacterium]